VSDLEDFDHCIKHLTCFIEYIEREKQFHQDYEDEVTTARAGERDAAERNCVGWMPLKKDESEIKCHYQNTTKQPTRIVWDDEWFERRRQISKGYKEYTL
jgi:hypothetical protein